MWDLPMLFHELRERALWSSTELMVFLTTEAQALGVEGEVLPLTRLRLAMGEGRDHSVLLARMDSATRLLMLEVEEGRLPVYGGKRESEGITTQRFHRFDIRRWMELARHRLAFSGALWEVFQPELGPEKKLALTLMRTLGAGEGEVEEGATPGAAPAPPRPALTVESREDRLLRLDLELSELSDRDRDYLLCRAVARDLWRLNDTRSIASILKDPRIEGVTGNAWLGRDTMRGWIQDLDPRPPERKTGRRRGSPKGGG